MKRHGNLWNQIIAFENLLLATHQAQREKRFRANVLKFNYNLEQELGKLSENCKARPISLEHIEPFGL